jgi:hypothetical protein
MKKVLLTLTVASLAISSQSFAAPTGKGKGGKTTKTEAERREEQRKTEQAVAPGISARKQQALDVANQLLLKTRVVTGSDIKLASDRLAESVEQNIFRLTDLEALEQNSSREVAINAANLISVAAMKNHLRRDSRDANIAAQAEGFAKFNQIEILNNLTGKTQWTTEAEAKLNTTLIETTRALREGDASKLFDALTLGLKKAGFTEERIREILKECFKITA